MNASYSTIGLANSVKSLIGNETYYGLSKTLGLSRQCIKFWYDNGTIMSDETGVQIAEMLGIDPKAVLLSLQIERMQRKGDDKMALLWRDIAAGINEENQPHRLRLLRN